MQENKANAQRTDIAHGKEINAKQPSVERAPVGELIAHCSTGNIPTDKQTGEQRTQRQQILSCEFVAEVQNAHS